MEKLCINPVDKGIKLRVESLKILNEFKVLGFVKVSGFIGVVQQNLEEYRDYKCVKRLLAFWAGRVADADLNADLLKLLEQLKNE